MSLEHYPSRVGVIGFDYSEGMLKEASRKTRDENVSCDVNLLQMDAQTMAFPNACFDRVMAAYVLTVVPDPVKVVREILRVAKPGAKVVIINHLRSGNSILAKLEDLLHPVFSAIGLFNLDSNLLEVLESCGIRDMTLRPTSFLRMHFVITFTVPEQ